MLSVVVTLVVFLLGGILAVNGFMAKLLLELRFDMGGFKATQEAQAGHILHNKERLDKLEGLLHGFIHKPKAKGS